MNGKIRHLIFQSIKNTPDLDKYVERQIIKEHKGNKNIKTTKKGEKVENSIKKEKRLVKY